MTQMSTAPEADWLKDFGISGRKPPTLFTSKDDLSQSTTQAHLLRRAFDVLAVDGILCSDHSPLVYFKRVKRVTLEVVHKLHQQFWNHGGAPVLVIVSDDRVHIYSGMTPPAPMAGDRDIPSLVDTLDRVALGVREFVTAIESGAFFRQHQRSFNPAHRVDRDLMESLRATREQLHAASPPGTLVDALDALLCRLVFTCYLFDRQVIGKTYLSDLHIPGASHLRDVLSIRPSAKAKNAIYRLFKRLGEDFNGDLFSDDLKAEADLVLDQHISTLAQFFGGTNPQSGQTSFWPYDFRFIPIETISAIYERFLSTSDKSAGAFYTPRFLAEVVLDTALKDLPTLLGKRFLDPACGSGIFLVGLFNRIAEEWKQANPGARNDTKARELMRLLRESLFGVDINETACRITAFSLYLAYLDQLSPRDIQALQEKGRALPGLIVPKDKVSSQVEQGNIWHADFFDENAVLPSSVSIVVGNPPWGSTANEGGFASRWCATQKKPLPDKQIATAFIWKAVEHVAEDGNVCLVLPHGVLFHHGARAVAFQKAWVQAHSIGIVLNLVDFQRFLFEKAEHPTVVVSYRKSSRVNKEQTIEYWSPKADWMVTRTEVIAIGPQDRTSVSVGEVLRDLDGPDAPQIWKQRCWATPRDWRLLDRLSSYSRLRDHTRGPKERSETKPWLMGVGFQPVGKGDDPRKGRPLELPSKRFIRASSPAVDLFILPRDCVELETTSVIVRSGSNRITVPFCAPHVLVAEGYTSVAFADFAVSFQHALRGIHGPEADRYLLVFLAAYLRTPVARYYLFHTSSSWGVSRQKVHVEEVLRLPFPLPDQQPDPKRCWQIVREVARIVTEASSQADADFVDRAGIVRAASAAVEPLVEEYFDVLPMEKLLIEDTDKIIIPSVRPTRARPLVPTIKPTTQAQRTTYCARVCSMLSNWARRGKFAVRGQAHASESLGVGMAVFEKVEKAEASVPMCSTGLDLLQALDRLRRALPRRYATLDLVRGAMVFNQNMLYVVKPIGQRYWTQTAAMNDADEIAGTILMQSPSDLLQSPLGDA